MTLSSVIIAAICQAARALLGSRTSDAKARIKS